MPGAHGRPSKDPLLLAARRAVVSGIEDTPEDSAMPKSLLAAERRQGDLPDHPPEHPPSTPATGPSQPIDSKAAVKELPQR